MSEDLFPFPPECVNTLYDYIDGDGDMITLDVVDEKWLAISVIQHGKTAALTTILSEPGDARKMAGHLTSWAEQMEAR